jgi:hypothetical protein
VGKTPSSLKAQFIISLRSLPNVALYIRRSDLAYWGPRESIDRSSLLVWRLRQGNRGFVIKNGISEGPGGHRSLLHNVVAYTIAIAILWYIARGVSWGQIADAASHATLWLFISVSLAGFLCWFVGETFLYSYLFSFFHGQTRSFELLPTMGAMYFLQIVNSLIAGGALLLFMHTRKRVPWLTAGGTLLFQAYVDVMLLVTLSIFSIVVIPTSALRPGLYYALGVVVVGCFIGSFFLVWGARLSPNNPLRWIYAWPSMATFRLARPSQFIKLAAIKFLICLAAGLVLYGQFVSFHIAVPLAQAFALSPLVVAVGNSPFSPGGIGTTQMVFIFGFAGFAGKGDLFALSLAVSAFNLLVRIPMGFAMSAPLAEVVETVADKRTLTTTLRAG